MPDIRKDMVAGPLQNVSIAFKNTEYIADDVFPIIDGADPKAKVTTYKIGSWFRDEAGIRAPGSRARRGTFQLGSVSVNTKEYAFASEVTDEDRRFARSRNSPPLQPDQDAIEFATNAVDLKKEVRTASVITAGTWADGNSGGEDAEGLWSPAGETNTFLADLVTGKKTLANYGIRANCLIVDLATFEALKEVAAIKDKIKYTSMDSITPKILARLLELDEIKVGRAVKSSANEKADGSDFTAVKIWEVNAGKGMGFLYHRPPKVGLKTPMPGAQIRIAYGQEDGGGPRRVSTWRESAEHQDVYEVAEETDILQVSAACGYLWKDTYAT